MIGFIVAGIVIGLLARLVVPGRQRIGLWGTLAIGVIGSVIGGTVAAALDTGDVWELNFLGFVVAVFAAAALLAAAEGLTGGRHRKSHSRHRRPHPRH